MRIDVVGAIIEKNGKILIAQRSCSDLNRKWEFPGGKVESGESHQYALHREISEELYSNISVGSILASTDFNVKDKLYTLHCYWASIVDGDPTPGEHYDIAWVSPGKLLEYDLAPADIPIAKQVISHVRRNNRR